MKIIHAQQCTTISILYVVLNGIVCDNTKNWITCLSYEKDNAK